MKKTLIFAASCAAFAAFAGVPIKWSVETSRADERVIEVYHGESLDMEVTFKSYGEILQLPTNEVAATFWQTNGMNTAYWRTNNVEIIASNGVMRTTFGPEQDVGAKTLRGFIGIPGQIYRAAFVLRFKDAPGYNVAIVEWPYRLLDFNTIEVVNPPYYTKAEIGGVITNAVDADLVNELESDPTVPEWAMQPTKPSYTAREVGALAVEWRDFSTDVAHVDEFIKFENDVEFNESATILIPTNNLYVGGKKFDAMVSGITNDVTTEIKEWAETEFQKSWDLEEVELGKDASAGGTRTTAIGAYAEASGISGIALGNDAKAKGSYPVAVGMSATATNDNAVAVGPYANAGNGGLSAGVGAKTGTGGVALGPNAEAADGGIAIGNEAKAGQLATAIGREAKALHTGAVAIGPYAETTADNTMRIKFDPSEIYLGSAYLGKSLQQYFNELTPPDVDWEEVSNVVKNADFMPTKFYRPGTTQEAGKIEAKTTYLWQRASTHIEATPARPNTDNIIFDMGSNVFLNVKSGGQVTINDGSKLVINNVDSMEFRGGGVTKNFGQMVEASETDPTVPDWAKEENKPTYTASEVGAYSAANGATLEGNVSTISSQLNTIGSTLNTEDAKFEITNYNSVVHMPEASFSVKVQNESTGSNEWIVAWQEMTRWNWFLGFFGTFTNDLNTALANKGEKEYAFYDGVTGNPAPDGFFWISQPRVAICAGMAYQRYADAQGEVWVLESNGMVAEVNGTTNGFFRITDSENEVQFEIIKGNKRTLGAAPRTMSSQVMGVTHYFTSYATTNAVSNPVARFKRDLQSGDWVDETELDCPCNTSWTDKGGGIYECEWWPKSTEPKMFMCAVYETGGSTRIVQHAPVEMQKIIIGGVEYTIGTATISGQTVLTLTP